MSNRKITTIQTVHNEGANSVFRRHITSQYLEATDQYSVQFTSTYDTAKNPEEHRVELQLFLTYNELQSLHNAIGSI
jgi:hypothetical protein